MAFKGSSLVAGLAAAVVAFAAGSGVAQDRRPAPAAPPAQPAPVPQTGARLAPGQPIPAGELEAFVDGLAAEAMGRDHVAGLAISVVQDGQLVFKKGYGVDRLSPARRVDPDRTLFRIGQITSALTWIAMMREIEAGHIRLDAPINVYLPQKDQVHDQGYKTPITVRDVIAHTAGFEDRSLGQLIERDPNRIRPLDVYLRQERPRRVRDPGALPSYSDYGVALAGEALAQVTGKLPEALVEGEVLRPLGLSRTSLREPYPARAELPLPMDAGLAGDVSEGFRWTGQGFKARPFEFMTQAAPAVAGSSTAADMARLMLAMLGDGTLDGASIYSPGIARDFRTRLPSAATGAPAFDHGMAEYLLPGGVRGYGVDGATLSFRSRLVTAPDLKLGVFVAANTESADALVAELPQRIVQRFYGAPQPAPGPSDWLKQNASAFQTTYLTTRRAYHGLEQFVQMFHAESKVTVTDEGLLVTPGPGGPWRWTPDGDPSLDQHFVNFKRAGGADALAFEIDGHEAGRWFSPQGDTTYERSNILAHPWLLELMALAAALGGAGAIGGLFLRDRREFRQTSIQGRADAAQISASILWLASMAAFLVWRAGSGDTAKLMYDWPGAWLLVASACAFVAAVMTAICVGLAPIAWRGGRRLDSWNGWRKARFTVTTVVFTLFGLLVGLWGGLEPWSR